jgi:2-octaprenylphenol hydroxylase
MVGTTVACGLMQSGLRVAVVEAREPQQARSSEAFDVRVSALTRATESILRHVGVWGEIPPERLSPFRQMHVWDATGRGEIHFDSADIGEPTLGYIVENRLIERALARRLSQCTSVDWIRPATLTALRTEDDRVELRIGRSSLHARLVIGADGTDSRVRTLATLPSVKSDYQQQAVVAVVRTARDHCETAWQRFLPTGPLAFLPLPDGYSAVVWSTVPRRAESLMAMDAFHFAIELEAAFCARLGAITWVGERHRFTLRRLRAQRYVGRRAALVGDAAHTVHPLAGQGVNLGFLDAAALVTVIEQAQVKGRDFGGPSALRRYERWRKGHNLVADRVMDTLSWLFTSPQPPIRLARNWGLSATDQVALLKRLIMRRAAGLDGDFPPLAREPSAL